MYSQKPSFDEFDEIIRPAPETTDFDRIIDAALSRRDFLGHVVKFGTASFIMGAGLESGIAHAASRSLVFAPVAANSLDTITVPNGYSWHVVASWGDPLWSNEPEFDAQTRGTAASQAKAIGDNNDGMDVFFYDGRSVLVVNNEYVNWVAIHGNRESGKPETLDDIAKGKAGHGLSIFEIAKQNDRWTVVKDSPYNRRIVPDTPIKIAGPAAGHKLMQTAADSSGTGSLGTWNNCGNGITPWGTYLACEENFNGYFSSSAESYTPTAQMKRYGVGTKGWGYRWAEIDERFDISKHPNECNRAGYVVEINPEDPSSIPEKRTAMGRFKHENAEVCLAKDNRVVVYMGDDERGEFLYKYVSNRRYEPGAKGGTLLDDGNLFVAKFHEDGSGEWLPLTPQSANMNSQAEVCILTRMAASNVGATTMDRPEWVAVNPNKVEAYCSLTNNKNRGVKTNAGGDPTPVGGPNPRKINNYGQIVRWVPDGEDHAATGFTWDLYVLAGNPVVHKDAKAGSPNVNAGNMFNSPDGIRFDSQGRLWIQTDGNYSNKKDFAGHGNNQMLLGDTNSGEISRFMVGPNECEITGATWSKDKKTMFVGVQHPGDKGHSRFPGSGNAVPRSSIIAILRDDGKQIG